ncbi:MAG: FAD-dependent oxidoreductase [Coriobacteriales bacterium]|jgi:2,4-dienoyl-CoA reductase-like NADH-dependent reductase (Old Yellow Enzyme family)/thioredoxin reductase
MSEFKYPHLFEPITIGNRYFRNRIFASPTGYQNLPGNGHLNCGAPYYYGRRAMGGAASVATFEGIVDQEYGKGGPNHICLDVPGLDAELGRVAHAISDYGAVPTLELTHAGMFANRALGQFGAKSFGPAKGPVEVDQGDRIVEAMDEEFIERTIQKFIDGAALGQKVGFGMVLIHAGHGWGLHQFLSPIINTRTDKWGGPDAENRCRMLNAIIDGIHKRCGRNFPVEVRISGSECYDGGFGLDTGIANAKSIAKHADLIHVSAGNHEVDEVFTITHPSMFQPDGVNVYMAEAIKKEIDIPVSTVGALSDPELMEEIIATGKADIVECAREFICEPDFPNMIRAGEESNMKRCMRCLACFSNELTHGEPYCAINPRSGREIEAYYAMPEVKNKKKVLIIGGGVAGMEAALDCAERGHEVTLCEAKNELGGTIRCERNVDFKTKLDYYLNQQQRKCFENPNIDVRLNTKMTPEMAKEMNADVIIAALGSKQFIPPIPGIDGPNVMNAVDAYNAADQLGQKIVIMGAGLVGIELGLHLCRLGKDVTNVEMLDHMSDGGNFLHMSGVRVEIKKRGLKVNLQNKVKEVKENGVLCETPDGDKFYEADSVIVAMGMRPLQEETTAFYDCAPQFFPIGDCFAVKNIEAATTAGYMTAKNIGRF